jgi:hypothetical protein
MSLTKDYFWFHDVWERQADDHNSARQLIWKVKSLAYLASTHGHDELTTSIKAELFVLGHETVELLVAAFATRFLHHFHIEL